MARKTGVELNNSRDMASQGGEKYCARKSDDGRVNVHAVSPQTKQDWSGRRSGGPFRRLDLIAEMGDVQGVIGISHCDRTVTNSSCDIVEVCFDRLL